MVLVITGRIQLRLKPYKEESNNEVEILAITAGVITILSNLVYAEEEEVHFVNHFVLVVTIFFNLVFLFKWILLMAMIFEDKSRIAKVVSVVYCEVIGLGGDGYC